MSAFEYYKTLHKMPELSEKEVKTSQYIFNTLVSFGYSPVVLGETGVYTDLLCDEALPWILLRADIDALPLKENSGVDYCSQNEGVMHACGHDAHTAMLLDLARTLYDKKLPHNIRFLFQSAEETTTGAMAAIEAGVVPQNLIACFAMHVWPGVPFGNAVTKCGWLMASSDVFRISFSGKSSHCSNQEKGNNALLSAVDMVSALPQIKQEAANDNALLFCGSIHSGDSHNIVPDKSELYGTIRTYSTKHQEKIKKSIKKTAKDIANKYGTTASVMFEGGCPPVYNDQCLVSALISNDFGVTDIAEPTLAAEDFACFGKFAPSCMLWLGLGDTPPLHNEKFYVPQDILPIGVDLWTKIATFDWNDVLK